MVGGLVLPAWPVSGWQSQPAGPRYQLLCGSAVHATLQGWTGPAGDATEARDRAYCARWGAFNVHLGEGLLAASSLVSVCFLTVVLVGDRKARALRLSGLPA